ncbi:NAD(P)/FAD-dependent oxidoreductase [Dyadobacter luticola]|uniref:FAD-binding protein n=1 Tax=Dyadobacter luticola TaxID=1979387 RepID=A0A5R9L4U1_9BACT|nr:NAD(P)-binding protein [Dyadobacter luticola]TLV03592.1 FAD-binding protein [Dyadobacter luticola]
MEMQDNPYHCAIIGGGLAGLCLAIQLADKDFSVILFEKNTYPFHKVCGEYISLESRDFLKELGLPFESLNLPIINKLGVSSERGFMLEHDLQLGGFGISRYSLDNYLFQIAEKKGVTVLQNCKVRNQQDFGTGFHQVQTNLGDFRAKAVCGSYGKYTPNFMGGQDAGKELDSANYIGVKYHIKSNLAANRIELHNFQDGYCGISKVDQDWHCLCYLTTAKNLRAHGKNVKEMERHILHRNPFLKTYFTESEFIYDQPLIISNVQFSKKHTDLNGAFLLGDAAGSITPLCGNGMSMAMRASKLLEAELTLYFGKKQTKEEAREHYKAAWNKAFLSRITAGYYLQGLFGKKWTTDLALRTLAHLPGLTNTLVSLTHGEPF